MPPPHQPTDWRPIETIPPSLKDGRPVLLWIGSPDIGVWNPEPHWDQADRSDGHWESLYENAVIKNPTHYAELTEPR